MRTLTPQEFTTVAGAGLFDFLFKKKTTVGVNVVAGASGSTKVDVKSPLANVLVCVSWGKASSPCGCGGNDGGGNSGGEPN